MMNTNYRKYETYAITSNTNVVFSYQGQMQIFNSSANAEKKCQELNAKYLGTKFLVQKINFILE